MSRILSRRDVNDLLTPERLFSRFFNEPFLLTTPTGMEEGTLAVDVSEDEKSVIVRASLPGFRKEDIGVEIHDGVLSIKAEHSEQKEERTEKFFRRERTYGSVSRRVALPSPVMEDEARAELKDGVLELRIPKTKEASPKRISIK